MPLHLTAEFTTAFLLILSGAGSLLGATGISVAGPVALGMFAVLTVLTSAAIVGILFPGA